MRDEQEVLRSSSGTDEPRRETIARIISPDWFDNGEALSNYPGQHRKFQDMALAKADAILGMLAVAQVAVGNATIEAAMWMLQDVPGDTLVERIARLTKWYQDLYHPAQRPADSGKPVAWRSHHVDDPEGYWSYHEYPIPPTEFERQEPLYAPVRPTHWQLLPAAPSVPSTPDGSAT